MAETRRDLELPEVSEGDATGEVAEIYDRIRTKLRAGVVPYVWRTFATRPQLLRGLWEAVEPAIDEGFFEAAEGIRALAIERVREGASGIEDHRALLGDELAKAVEELRVFLEVNPRLLILMCALDRAWRGEDVGGVREAEPAEEGVPRWHPPDIETARSSRKVAGVYDDMAETLDIPAPTADYQVLAKWPAYLRRAWEDLRSFVGTDSYTAVCATIESVADQAAVALPSRIDLSRGDAGALGLQGDEVEEVGGWIASFHRLLPGLIANDSYFWLGMNGGTDRLPPAVEVAAVERGGDEVESERHHMHPDERRGPRLT